MVVYTVREFRKKLKEALDKCVHEEVIIERDGIRYGVHRQGSGFRAESPDTSELTRRLVLDES